MKNFKYTLVFCIADCGLYCCDAVSLGPELASTVGTNSRTWNPGSNLADIPMYSVSKSMGLPPIKQPTALSSFKRMKAKVTKFSPNKGILSAAPLPQSAPSLMAKQPK